MRWTAFAIIALTVASDAYSQPTPPASKPATSTPKQIMIPDRNWTPKPGDEAEVVVADTPACQSELAHAEYMKAMKARDRVGMDSVIASKAVVRIPKGVRVLVVQTLRPRTSAGGSRIVSSEAFANSLLAAGFAAKDETIYPLEVRIVDGALKGMVRYVPEACVARMVPVASRVKHKGVRRPAGATIDPAKRAATLLSTAKNLEKLKKPKGALESYRQLVKDYPDSPETKEAGARIKVLEGK